MPQSGIFNFSNSNGWTGGDYLMNTAAPARAPKAPKDPRRVRYKKMQRALSGAMDDVKMLGDIMKMTDECLH